ncbi:hypothetical protein GCM10010211_24970 [Streptomyces albospinus]|uniref:DUF4232 domain-containing protein n=1 Tax=Streptomyces albospinus TaxID=285515 RepID=A0ABQ2UZT2_9ACTN|nr:DUF4232 domain-containing protein [Streptomyces albospinus]GGU59093.1 hypothetical protein GCM10010211_24970 [Streptomyces albospinus]
MPHTDAHARTTRTPRTARRRTVRIAAAGLTAVAALALTACGGQDDPLKTSAAKPFNPAPQDAKDPAANGTKGTQGTQGTEESNASVSGGGSAAKGNASGGRGGNATVTDGSAGTARQRGSHAPGGSTAGRGRGAGHTACDASRIRIVAKPLTRPINHLLLEATNTSGTTCDLYAAPVLAFEDAQSPVPDLPDSKPQAVVTLAPGRSGYAGVMTSGGDGGAHGRTVTSLSVWVAGRDGKGSVGGAAKVALPGGSAYIDDSARVSYWQADPSDAASW